jgi:endonuclease/exonuclease/phosphatase (EEP) superfamily protein YafD
MHLKTNRPSDESDNTWAVTGSRVLAAVPVALTVLPLWRTARGWVRIWDFPRLQIAALGLLGQACLLKSAPGTTTDRALLAALIASLLYQGKKILPYTVIHKKQVPAAADHRPDRRIRLLMANVLQSNRRSDLMLQEIRKASPDVICLVETDTWWDEQMRTLVEDYEWVHTCPLSNTYGMLLYSRLPIVSCEIRFLVRDNVPSMRAVVQLRSGDEVVIYALHPRPPRPNSPSFGRDAELVLVGREMDRERKPSLVIGDLNDVAWSYTTTLFQRLSHTVDPRVGRGMFNTFHAGHPLARYPLDHVFHTRHFTLAEIRRMQYTGSDHFPILVELAFDPNRKHEIPRPTPDADDHENADEIIEEAEDAGIL